ncbi:3-oxo-tetronate kinase [Leifsonia sp. SIMBA_070]|uniref:3-oxo-tetronate kinase n=1 Tax=Leifsonia sp. SIMBA_070 TaxID=3085810 RepID=UPI00397D9BDE
MRLGAVADDVTGACDLAGRVVEAGLPASVLLGVPVGAVDVFPSDGPGCAVVALKVRTAPVAEAVVASVGAARSLMSAGATQLYQKYCSTFDSTASGNIGPIADALADVIGATASVGTPATPGARRTQYQGTLFVDGVPLAESPMRDHPLTPMRDSDLVRLLAPQTAARVGLIRWEEVRRGASAVADRVDQAHMLVDALAEDDLDVIAEAVLRRSADRPVLAGGGAGVATALARAEVRAGDSAGASADAGAAALPAVPVTGRLILAGSASAATREQIAAFRGERHLLDPLELADGPRALGRLRDALAAREDNLAPVLVHASPDVTTAQRALGAGRAAAVLEHALSELAAFAVHELGCSHLLVAGGETSGAVTTRLGITRLQIGRQAAPGVPWAVATTTDAGASDAGGDRSGDPRTIAVLLKSGNFGERSLFTDAWEVAP